MHRDEIKQRPEDGVYIYGLYLDGASWNAERGQLDDAELGQLQSRVPVIHFKPTQNPKPDPARYACPMYKTSVRAGVLSTTGQSTNFVVAVHLPSAQPPDYWVLKGAALLCMLDS